MKSYNMTSSNFCNRILNTLTFIFFTFTYGIAISFFLSPNNLAPGGVSGIAIMINHIFGISTGLIIFLINIPLLLISFVKLGKIFFFKTLMGIFLTSYFIDYLSQFKYIRGLSINPITTNSILAAFIGGFLLAFSIGSIFKTGATTGGTDIVVRLLKLKYPHIETGQLFMLVDMIIVGISAFVFKSIETALYACVTLFVTSYFLDKILYGTNKAILMFIITSHESTVIDSLLVDLDVGMTLLNGQGAYNNNNYKVIMCGIKKHQYPKAEKIICSIDPDAFIINTQASEILGKGFLSLSSNKL